MKQLNVPMFLLAFLVILMFIGSGAAIAMRNTWLIILFLLLGFGFMGYGLTLKRKRSDS
ncbi:MULTISPECIES: DUF5325 family protein [unclassified Virgibacillus]|uniref:DUF5325 family protein n=1 Tax=unclassified Virgibacillus TaxID=2620237 RepID=UPI0024DE02FB|nr:DUF5325 family protein [Virgibacillus sp. LDC-1]